MTGQPSMSAETVVSADPTTAFRAFTEEIDEWWLAGPINYHDASRAVGLRCEPGVGGRLVEVYDTATGDGLELGRITVWEPGRRLVWTSSIDDIEMTVRFQPTDVGTRVVVEGHLPSDGQDKGGSAWVRVVPTWLAAWCTRRDQPRPERPAVGRLAVAVSYQRPVTCARWINDVLGFESTLPLPSDDDAPHQWIEFRFGGGLLIVLKSQLATDTAAATVPWLFVDDLDAHHSRATTAGAEIVDDIHQHGYRAYTLADPEGRHWTIAQALPALSYLD